MNAQRILLLAGGLAAAVVLFLLVRPDGDEAPATAETPATGATTTEPAPEGATEPETQPEPEPEPEETTVRILVRDGVPVGGVARPAVARGERVRIVVRADVVDHVHLHGYDLTRDVAPGTPAQLVFDAGLTGVFEVELEERGILLAELEVGP